VNAVKKYALSALRKYAPSTLLAIGLAIAAIVAYNAMARNEQSYQGNQNQQSYQGNRYQGNQNQQGSQGNQTQQGSQGNQTQQGNNGQTLTHSVPDGGSTAALLGLSVALVVFAQRKFAMVK
jgi:hypothetical protein